MSNLTTIIDPVKVSRAAVELCSARQESGCGKAAEELYLQFGPYFGQTAQITSRRPASWNDPTTTTELVDVINLYFDRDNIDPERLLLGVKTTFGKQFFHLPVELIISITHVCET